MQESHGGGNEPREFGARTPQPDSEVPEQDDSPAADATPAGQASRDPVQSASRAEQAAEVTSPAPAAAQPAPAQAGQGDRDDAQGGQPDEAPTSAPGTSWVPGGAGEPAGGGGSWTAPGVAGPSPQEQARPQGQPGAPGPEATPPAQGQPAQGQPGTPGPWATPPAQGQPGASGPWATPPAQGQPGASGPWATPPAQGRASASGPWSILPGPGQQGEHMAPGTNWAGPGGGHEHSGGQGSWILPPGPPGGYGQEGGFGEPPRRRPRHRFLIYGLVAVLAAGAGAVAAALAVPRASNGSAHGVSAQQIPSPGSNSGSTNTSSINVSAVASKVEPGVVDIVSQLHYSGQVFEGTGMVLSPSGLVLTNNHVVAGTTHLTATLVTSGHKYTATVVGTDAKDDVALIRLQGASGLKTVTVGNSAKVTLGTPVVAIGNAGGRGGLPTVTSGTITSLHQTITATDAGANTSETLHNMLQTNAPIAEGDSGGPLSNGAGQVIGMDTAANTQNIGGPGTDQGFAIPINRALSIAREIAAGHGNASIQIGLPAFMGVQVARVPAGSSGTPRAQLQQLQRQASQFGDSINSSLGCLNSESGSPVPSSIAPASSGTLIAGVFCHDPAATAGLKAGDVITAVDGHRVTEPKSLTQVLSHYRPGDTVSVTWIAVSGQQHTGSLKLTSGPAK